MATPKILRGVLRYLQDAETPVFIAPTLLNSWVNFGSSYAAAGYYKDPFGRIHLRGLVKSGTIGSTIFTLPSGYRPATLLIFPTLQFDGTTELIGRIDVLDTGAVNQSALFGAADGNGYLSLNGISFAVA